MYDYTCIIRSTDRVDDSASASNTFVKTVFRSELTSIRE